MQIRNSSSKYGIVAKTLHWVVALMIIAAWAVGYYGTELMSEDSPNIAMLFDLHKSVGMAILMLALVRLSWRLYSAAPRLLPMPKLQALVAQTVHYSLYAFMFIQPISGWFMSSAAGYPPSLFGLFTFPDIIAKNSDSVGLYRDIHNVSAYILLGLFILHVAGAWYHHLVAKDGTLRRMTW